MSYALTEQVIRIDGHKAGFTIPLKAVLGSLASHAKNDGTEARPSVETISLETCISRRWVQKTLRELERLNLIIEVAPANRYAPTNYRINVEALDALPKIIQGRTQDAPDPNRTTNQGRTTDAPDVSQENRQGRTQDAPDDSQGRTVRPAGANYTTSRGALSTPESVLESVQESKTHPLPPQRESVGPADASEDQESGITFQEFWNLYPRKVGRSAALTAWNALLGSTVRLAEPIRSSLKRQATSPEWTRDGGRYIPHPARWLKERRWEDEAPVVIAGPVPMDPRELRRRDQEARGAGFKDHAHYLSCLRRGVGSHDADGSAA